MGLKGNGFGFSWNLSPNQCCLGCRVQGLNRQIYDIEIRDLCAVPYLLFKTEGNYIEMSSRVKANARRTYTMIYLSCFLAFSRVVFTDVFIFYDAPGALQILGGV